MKFIASINLALPDTGARFHLPLKTNKMKVVLIMTTKDGVALYFNEREGFLSSNPEAVRTALKEDINSKDLIASKMAKHIWAQAELSGGIKELSHLF